MNSQSIQSQLSIYVPAITTTERLLVLFGRDKEDVTQAQPIESTGEQTAPTKAKSKKHMGLRVEKYEVAEDTLKFSNMKGFGRKHWVVIKEIPLKEATAVEFEGNWLNVTWQEDSHQFLLKKKGASFAKLYEQLQEKLEANRQSQLKLEQAALRRTELLAAINTFLPAVDAAFNVLLALHEKRVNWELLEDYISPLGNDLSFRAETLSPLELDFTRVAAAVKREVPSETSTEVFMVLKTIYRYFEALNPEEDFANYSPNCEHAKALMLGYYILNDLMLARILGDTNSEKEMVTFEGVLAELASQFNFKLASDGFEQYFGALDDAEQREGAVLDARLQFRKQLKQLSLPQTTLYSQ